jgi:hypothetical protein
LNIFEDHKMKSLISTAILFAISVASTLPAFAAPWVGTPRVDDYTEIVKSSGSDSASQVSGVYLRSGNVQNQSGGQNYYGELQLVVKLPQACNKDYIRLGSTKFTSDPEFMISYSDASGVAQYKNKVGLSADSIRLQERTDGLYEAYLTLDYPSSRTGNTALAMEGLMIEYKAAVCEYTD